MLQEREASGLGLREMAKRIGVSPTYLSMVERGAYAPSAEDKVRKIAGVLDADVDEILALAGRISSDLGDVIKYWPRQMVRFMRMAHLLNMGELASYRKPDNAKFEEVGQKFFEFADDLEEWKAQAAKAVCNRIVARSLESEVKSRPREGAASNSGLQAHARYASRKSGEGTAPKAESNLSTKAYPRARSE